MISFGSDNHSGIHPRMISAINAVNKEHDFAYGDDVTTLRSDEMFSSLFGCPVRSFYMMNGTGTNVTLLKSVTRSYHSVICASTAHINVDECGAPERQSGCKVVSVPTLDGKLTPELVKPYLTGFGFCHHSQPKVISISQTTELGTVYTKEEILALSELAHSYDMYLHVDGARLANAVAAVGCDVRSITVDAGVDILSFGGTKNGMMMGEAAIFFNLDLAVGFEYERKQAMQLYSKMRFVAAQFEAYLEGGLWIELATSSNSMARYMRERMSEIKEVKVTQEVSANALFVIFPEDKREIIRSKYFFYDWNEAIGEVRLMCSFDTKKEHIDDFIEYIKTIIK